MIQDVEHTAIASPDPDRLAKFYVQYLDFTINYHSETSRTYFVRTNDRSMLEIILTEPKQVVHLQDVLTMTMRELILAVDTVKKCNRVVQVGTQIRSLPAAGGLGKIFKIEQSRNGYADQYTAWMV